MPYIIWDRAHRRTVTKTVKYLNPEEVNTNAFFTTNPIEAMRFESITDAKRWIDGDKNRRKDQNSYYYFIPLNVEIRYWNRKWGRNWIRPKQVPGQQKPWNPRIPKEACFGNYVGDELCRECPKKKKCMSFTYFIKYNGIDIGKLMIGKEPSKHDLARFVSTLRLAYQVPLLELISTLREITEMKGYFKRESVEEKRSKYRAR